MNQVRVSGNSGKPCNGIQCFGRQRFSAAIHGRGPPARRADPDEARIVGQPAIVAVASGRYGVVMEQPGSEVWVGLSNLRIVENTVGTFAGTAGFASAGYCGDFPCIYASKSRLLTHGHPC